MTLRPKLNVRRFLIVLTGLAVLVCLGWGLFLSLLPHTELIHRAARDGDIAFLKILFAMGAGVDTVQVYKSGATPLFLAVEYEQIETAEFLLKRGANPNARNSSRRTPLSNASERGSVTVVKLLLEYGALADERDPNGTTPLYYALYAGRYDIAATLRDAGAPINYATLSIALSVSDDELFEFFIENGVDLATVRPEYGTLVRRAVESQDKSGLKAVLPHAIEQFKRRYHAEIASRGVRLESEEIADNLLGVGFEKETERASAEGNVPYLAFLVLHGTKLYEDPPNDPIMTNTSKNVLASFTTPSSLTVGVIPTGTVLHRAVILKDETVVRMLVRAGFSPATKDSDGRTPLDWAMTMGLESMYDLLG